MDRPSSLVPVGSRFRPDSTTVVRDGGRHLLGGAPLRSVRLSASGAVAAGDLLDGRAVADDPARRRLARRLLDAGLLHPVPPSEPVDGVTVVTPVRDDPAGVASVVADHPDVRVVVVDDGSHTPVTVTGSGVTLLRHEMSQGPGAARMTGFEAVDTPLVAFVDADVRCPRGWLGGLVGHFADPEVVAVAPRVRAPVGRSLLERYERDASPLDLGAEPSPVGPGRRVPYVPSAALLVRTAALASVGGFDPALRHGEDVDLVWRLVAAGHTVRYDPDIEVEHRIRRSWRAWRRQRSDYGSSAAALARRHGDAVAPAVVGPPAVAVLTAALVAPPPVAATVAGTVVLATRRRLSQAVGARLPVGVVERGLLHACRSAVEASIRAWLPLTVVAVVGSRRFGRRLPVLVSAAVAVDWSARRRRLDPVRWAMIRLVDHGAYGVGVWRGIVKRRSARCLAPRFVTRAANPSTGTVVDR